MNKRLVRPGDAVLSFFIDILVLTLAKRMASGDTLAEIETN